ncbi:InlB B-repeat-containing protein [Allofustis seminis]|uniref:InlB B-repeat-containing protein n=1 Tax=Allofustis seminis TaxID=166939 RepID=UPI0003790944|nr:InlB B-repeat-containing protein [Allofustis seminis]
MKERLKGRWLAGLLTVALFLSILPINVFAEQSTNDSNQVERDELVAESIEADASVHDIVADTDTPAANNDADEVRPSVGETPANKNDEIASLHLEDATSAALKASNPVALENEQTNEAVQKTFTITKKLIATPDAPEEKVGDFDTYDNFVRQGTATNARDYLFTIYLNKDYDVADHDGEYIFGDINVRITSGNGGPFSLNWNNLNNMQISRSDASFDNIILDGHNTTNMMLINNSNVKFNAGATFRNFKNIDGRNNNLRLESSRLTIEDGVVFENNTNTVTANSNAPLSVDDESTLIINGGVFRNNTNKSFGGVILSMGTVVVNGGQFTNNTSEVSGGAIASYNSQLTINGGTFESNKAKNGGAFVIAGRGASAAINGGTYKTNSAQFAGAAFVDNTASANITGGIFESNQATGGGAIYVNRNAVLNIAGTVQKPVIFTGNSATYQGGAVNLNKGTMNVEHAAYLKNEAGIGGGAVFVADNIPNPATFKKAIFKENICRGFGGGLYVNANSKIDLEQCQFIDNQASYGGGVATTASRNISTADSLVSMKESDFTGNQAFQGGAVFTAFPTTIAESNFWKNNAIFKEGDHQNPHLSGSGGAINVMDRATTIVKSVFKENKAFGSGGAISINGVTRNAQGEIVATKADIDVHISDHTEFHGNIAEMGQGGAIYTIPFEYEDPITDPKAYKNITTDNTTLFLGNEAKAGKETPPANYKDFTHLKFSDASDVEHGTLKVKSLLNNHDINYKNPTKVITFDANGGQFVDGSRSIMIDSAIGQKIIIVDAPTRQGYTFDYWKGPNESKYNPEESYTVVENVTFTAQWTNNPPTLEVEDATITVGDALDLKTLIKKAEDKEDGTNLNDKVVIDADDFDNMTPGKYEIGFTLTDNDGATVTKKATVTVKDKKKDSTTEHHKSNKPNKSNKSSKQDETVEGKSLKKLPKTGHNLTYALYAGLMMLSMGILTVGMMHRKKVNK